MKRILSTVLALCMILGCVAAGFSAQAVSDGTDLQARINAAIANGTDCEWTGEDVNLTKPLTINGNVKIDFKGATIKGAAYKHTIIISGGNVELINADIEGIGGHYEGIINPSDHIRGFVDEISDACPTIYIGGGIVTMTNLVVTGAQLRMIGTGAPHDIPKVEIPGSDAITMANANAVLNLNNVRAFGNIGVENLYGSKVNVTECVIGGYTKDFKDRSNVSYAGDTTQYRNMDLIKEAFADCVTLTENEEKYMNKFFEHFLQVTASVKNQNYVEPTFDYNADTDTLTVTATADKSYDVQAECAFDYYYIPKTATLFEDTQDFVKTDALTYTATFENVSDNQEVNVDLIYKLAVDLGEDAETAINNAFAKVDELLDSIPDMLEGVNDAIYHDFIGKYIGKFYPQANDGKTDEGYATLLWNAYQEFGVDALLGDLNTAIEQADEAINNTTEGTQERAEAEAAKQDAINAKNKAEADIKAFFGPIFDLCGVELYANLDQYATLRNAIQAVRSGNYSTGQYNDVRNRIVATLNPKFGATFDPNPASAEEKKDLGKGDLRKLLDYWDNVYALAVQDGEFNNIKDLGEYLGANYLKFYDLLKDIKGIAHRLGDMLNDPDNYVVQMLGDNFQINGKGITEYVGLINDGLTMIDNLFAKADNFLATNSTYNGILNTFGDDVPKYCGIYAEKAFNIATNLDTYFDIETDGTYVEGFEFPQTATYQIPASADEVTVTVNVYGYGKYSVDAKYNTEDPDNLPISTTQQFNVAVGDVFTVAPVDMEFNPAPFKYFSLSDSEGNEKLSPTGGTLTVFNDTIINVYFADDVDVYEFTFMTNYELSTKYLNTFVGADEIDFDQIDLPDFTDGGAEFLGWANQNISGSAAQAADIFMSEDDIINAAEAANGNMTFYAIFSFPETEISTELLNNTVSITDNFGVTGAAYFTALFSDKALSDGDTIVEAGIILAGNEARINAATAYEGSSVIRGKANIAAYGLPLLYTYRLNVGNVSNVTVYAKAYVIIQHANGSYDPQYSTVYTVNF